MGGWELIRTATLNEVSLLSPGVEPAFPRSRVTWIGEPESSAAVPTFDAAGEVNLGGQQIVRRGCGRVLGGALMVESVFLPFRVPKTNRFNGNGGRPRTAPRL